MDRSKERWALSKKRGRDGWKMNGKKRHVICVGNKRKQDFNQNQNVLGWLYQEITKTKLNIQH